MRITIFGATGESGRMLTQQALAEGYAIVAYARDPAKLAIQTATPSAPDPQDSFDLKFKLAVLMIRLLIPSAYQDIVQTAAVMRATKLEWTIVRLPLLNSKPKQGKVNVGYLGAGKVNLALARADLVDFLLAQIKDESFMQKAPVISN